MKIIGANITGSFILNSQDVTTTIQTSNVWSGSVATDITALNATKSILKLALLTTLTYLLLNLASQSRISVPTTYKIATEDSVIELFYP
jgi:hypothetical protein